jgi:hypothetical protein
MTGLNEAILVLVCITPILTAVFVADLILRRRRHFDE